MAKTQSKKRRGPRDRKHLIGKGSNDIGHYHAVKEIARKYHLPEEKVEGIILAFFGIHGLKGFIKNKIPLKLRHLGQFYFHKATLEAEKRRKDKVEKYNKNEKQRNYYHRRKRLSSSQTN